MFKGGNIKRLRNKLVSLKWPKLFSQITIPPFEISFSEVPFILRSLFLRFLSFEKSFLEVFLLKISFCVSLQFVHRFLRYSYRFEVPFTLREPFLRLSHSTIPSNPLKTTSRDGISLALKNNSLCKGICWDKKGAIN